MPSRDRSPTARRLSLAGAVLLIVLGALLFVAVTYAPGLLGLGDDVAAGLALPLRGLGLLAVLGAGWLIVESRRDR